MSNQGNPQKPLRPIQENAISSVLQNLNQSINSLCYLGVGSGKTRVACEIIKHQIKENPDFNKTLVICPTVMLINDIWKETLTDLNIDFRILSSVEMKARKLYKLKKIVNESKNIVYLITYQMLITRIDSKNDECRNLNFFLKMNISLLIFDEFHTLSNLVGKNKILRHKLKSFPTKMRIGLTATPIVNSIEEKNEAFYILNPQLDDYDESFIVFEKGVSIQNEFFEQLFLLPLSNEESTEVKNIAEITKKADKKGMYPHLLLITGIVYWRNYKFEITTERTEIKALKTILESIPSNDKIIIFDNCIATLEYLEQCDFIKVFNPVRINGNISKINNEKSYQSFLSDEKCRLLLTTFQKSSEGINLQIANHIIILSLPWTPKSFFQAIGRIKRQGQLKPCFTYIIDHYRMHDSDNKPDYPDFPNYFLKKYEAMKGVLEKERAEIEKLLKIPKVIVIPKNEELEKEIKRALVPYVKIYSKYVKRRNLINMAIKKIFDLFYCDYIFLSNNINILNVLGYLLIENFSAIKALQIQSVYQNWNFKKLLCFSLINEDYELLFQIIKPKRSIGPLYTVLDILSTHINDDNTVIPIIVYTENEENTINIADNAYKDCELNLDEIRMNIISLSTLSYNDPTRNVLLFKLKELIIPSGDITKKTVIDLDKDDREL